MMQINGNRLLVIGAGFIGFHLVEQPLDEGAAQVRDCDNLSRGTRTYLEKSLLDPSPEVFADSGDILHRDTLLSVMEDMGRVFHLVALWFFQCHEYLRLIFDVNVAGTMNTIKSVIARGIKRLVFFFLSFSLWRCGD